MQVEDDSRGEETERANLAIHSVIHSGFFIGPLQVHYYSKALPTTALILCRSRQHVEALQANVSEGLALTWLSWALRSFRRFTLHHITRFIHSFIHYKHLYSASSSGATQWRSQPQHDQIKPP